MAKTKNVSVQDSLKSLYELQSIDSKLDELKILLGELPMEVNDLEDEIAGLETRIEKIKTAMEEKTDEISKYNAGIAESEALIERYNKQLDNVKNNREYDALSKELEIQKLDIQLSNKKIKGAEAEIEQKKEQLTSSEEKLDKRKSDLEEKKTELAVLEEKTEKDKVKLLNKSEKARKKIEDRLLKSYDKIRKTYRNGLAVVTVNRGACGGCFNQIPPQLQIEIGIMKNIVACEHCGRVIVDEAIAD